MRGFHHATILSPSFHVLRKERLAQWSPICVQNMTKKPEGYFQKNWMGAGDTLPETLTLFQTKICDFRYPISDLIKNLIPYFRPKALEPRARPERVTSTYTVGVNIEREMVLSPNDEEEASSKNIPNSRLECTNHTLFQTKMSKLIPYCKPKRLKKHTLWGRTYLYSLYKRVPLPRGEKRVTDYESRCLRKRG